MSVTLPLPAFLAAAASGDRRAWRELHRTYLPTTRAFLRTVGVRDADLDDACQEVFLQVFRYLPRFQGRADVRTWLYKICLSQAARLRRRQKLRDALAMLLHRAGPEARDPTRGSGLDDDQTQRRLAAALAQLRPHHRDVLVLYEIEGLSGEEVARVVGCPLATVWTRLHYARRAFTAAVEGGDVSGKEPVP